MSKPLFIGSLISIAFIVGIAKLATSTGAQLLLFPELAALAYDVFTRPMGVWARSPFMLFITPVAAAAAGTLLTKMLPYNLWSIAICITSAMIIIRILRSHVAPGISAALLPLALGVTSSWYPVAIAAGTGSLMFLSMLYQRFGGVGIPPMQANIKDDAIDKMERTPSRYGWLPVFICFLLLAYGTAVASGLRLVMFPPLVVIAFEMFAHAEVCPWAKRPYALPVASTITAAAGVGSVIIFGLGPLSVAVALIIGILTLRIVRLYLPPALAIALLPQVIPNVDWRFAYAVALGTTVLTAVFLVARSRLLPLAQKS